jgi:hypothetical protein
MNSTLCRLSDDELVLGPRDARIAAIRWDILPWGLVLDLDARLSEAQDSPLRRVWLAFDGVAEMTLELLDSRVPNGIWITSGIEVTEVSERFRDYSFLALLPTHAPDDTLVGRASRSVTIRAMNLVGVASRASTAARESGGLGWAQRVALARDEDFVEAFESLGLSSVP